MPGSQLLEIILFASIAGVILFRLYTVLGRRTGHERPPQDRFRLGRPAEETVGVRPNAARLASAERPADPVQSGLFDIQLADRSFDKAHFLTGARAAYEMILTAFAGNDRAILRPLLNDEVYAAFETAMKGREERGEKVTLTFVGFKDVKIIAAALKNRTAEVTIAFGAQLISATTDAKGAVIDGDIKSVRDVTDVWTFARDTRAHDPNWILVATSGEQL
ncbi:MAG: Tim44 domain-containing protein [Alphaproteobacteria bacterium]|nr:Tim44 domain-containing protein [Alphaproteobacteria bacterium]